MPENKAITSYKNEKPIWLPLLLHHFFDLCEFFVAKVIHTQQTQIVRATSYSDPVDPAWDNSLVGYSLAVSCDVQISITLHITHLVKNIPLKPKYIKLAFLQLIHEHVAPKYR